MWLVTFDGKLVQGSGEGVAVSSPQEGRAVLLLLSSPLSKGPLSARERIRQKAGYRNGTYHRMDPLEAAQTLLQEDLKRWKAPTATQPFLFPEVAR